MFHEGQQIGPYKLSRRLGRGGFGEVWLGERHGKFATTQVAVKLPLDEQVDHSAIEHEAQLWAKASGHPNVLPIIEADEYDGQIVIVSEYAPDGSLEDWLKTHGKMTVEKAVETTIQILDGLEFLHSRNIIHRDLKPANILLQGKTPRLADFGISRAMRTTVASQSQNISGTFAYMSPEALDGKRSVQTDIWSVGVNLYQFLTATLPFPHKEPSALFPAIIMREFEPLPDFVPSELKEIIAKSLAKLPENRYKTVNEMSEDLRRILVNFSFPQFAPAEVLPKEIISENITSPATLQNEAEKETVFDAKPADHLTATKFYSAPDSIATQISGKDSVVTQIPAAKTAAAAQVLPTEAQVFAERTGGGKKNNLSFLFIGAGVLIILVLIGIAGYNLSKSGGAAANESSNGNNLSNANTSNAMTNVNKSSNTPANVGDTDKNSIGMEFVYIPPGDFMMGSDIADHEKPIHKVTISKGFWFGKTEVTQVQWQSVTGSNPSKSINCLNCPVEQVSWDDAQSFISKLNAQNDGYKYRLPTEAEWEYAARAGTTGDYAGNLDAMAWYRSNSADKTHEVGTKQPNKWGLYDMHGNVSEWVQDWFLASYSSGTVTDPTGPASGYGRGLRGGNYWSSADYVRSASRGYSILSRSHDMGFRVVRQ